MSYRSDEWHWVCYKCGEQFDRSSEWQMSLVDNHMEQHKQLESR